MEEGTIVHVDYELYDGVTGDLIETTRESVAQEHETHQEGRDYTPLVCVVGSGNLIPGFEAALLEADADVEIDVTIPAVDAYGEKDPTWSRPSASTSSSLRSRPQPTLPRCSRERRRPPRLPVVPAAGRARIDYNPPMAGKDLRYSFKIVKVVEGREATVEALLQSNTGHSDFGVTFDGDDVNIVLPQTMLFDTNAAMMKFRLVTAIRDAMDDVAKVTFLEVHEPRGFGAEADADEDDGEVEDLSGLSVAELKERCKAAGLKVGGTKADLIARLQEASGEEE